MLTYNLNEKSQTPLYIMLYQAIKSDIASGQIAPNQKLPSKRELADHLMVSVITVQNAYSQLIAEGYIYAQERRGYFACELSYGDHHPKANKEYTFASMEAPPQEVYNINLCENSINSKQFPFSVWSKQMRQVISENYDQLLCKIPNMGLWSLRKAISDYLYRFRGMVIDPNLILIGAGAEYLYGIIIKLLGRDKVYAVESPGYKIISQIYNAEGLKTKYIPLDRYGLSAEQLIKEKADFVHMSPSHNFPTGIVMPIQRRMEILKWAYATEGRYIIEDDYDSEFRFASKPLPTMQSYDTGHRIIYMNTFSKTIAPSLRISYMILTPELAKKYHEDFGFYSCPVSGFEQYILERFIAEGYYERHINRMRRFYRQSRDSILSLIKNSTLSSTAKIKEEISGLHFVLKLKTTKSDGQLKELAKSHGLNISFLSDYATDNNFLSASELIINYSGIEVAHMQIAIDILTKII